MKSNGQTVRAWRGATTWHGLVPRLLQGHQSERVAEIGVWRGTLSARILRECPHVQQLLLVDSWAPVYANDPVHGWMVYGPGTDQAEMDDAYRCVVQQFASAAPRVEILRLPSVEAAQQIQDGSLDAVLIDALHTANAVMEDIAAWRPKLRPGGIMIGDDLSEFFPGVQVGVEIMLGQAYQVLDQTWWAFPNGVACDCS